jgi:hypothetical protein
MAKQKRFAHLYELTKSEADAYVQEMAMEAKLLVKLFPHLHDAFDRDELPISFLLKSGARRSARRKSVRKRK